jgi:lipoprotein-anchoring transpeptidase ErfK/SrfK
MRFPIHPFFSGRHPITVLGVILITSVSSVLAQSPEASPTPAPMKKASEILQKQEPSKVSPRVLETLTPETAQVRISLSKQRAYLMDANGEIAIDTPISSGKAAGMTPTGSFKITEKDADHSSNLYGNFVDKKGRVVRSGVSTRIDSAPSGTRFEGAPMKWFMRFNGAIGMHVGLLPGYPASHGCVRLPEEIAAIVYSKVKIGTPVEVVR